MSNLFTQIMENLGFVLVCIAVIAGIGLLAAVIALLYGAVVGSWIWVLLSVWLALAIQLVALGLVGAYVGKTYAEVKARPRYHIEMLLDDGKSAQ